MMGSEVDIGFCGMPIYLSHAMPVAEECADVVFERFLPAYCLQVVLHFDVVVTFHQPMFNCFIFVTLAAVAV